MTLAAPIDATNHLTSFIPPPCSRPVSRCASSALYWRSMARFPTGHRTTDSPPRHRSTPGAAITRATPGVLDGATSLTRRCCACPHITSDRSSYLRGPTLQPSLFHEGALRQLRWLRASREERKNQCRDSSINCYPCRWTNLLPMSPAVPRQSLGEHNWYVVRPRPIGSDRLRLSLATPLVPHLENRTDISHSLSDAALWALERLLSAVGKVVGEGSDAQHRLAN